MGTVVNVDEFSRSRAMEHLLRARRARDLLDTGAQLEHAEAACKWFERDRGGSGRGVAGLLEATGLEIDARGASCDHDAALARATQTVDLLAGYDVEPLAREIARRHVRRSREVSGEADSVMREAMAVHLVLRQAPIDRRQRDVESLSALTTVISAAHRLGSARSVTFANRAIEMARPLHAAVARYDQRAAARYAMWSGLFLSSEGERPEAAAVQLGRYLAWCGHVPTRRNRLLAQFAFAEQALCAGNMRCADDAFRAALDGTQAVLPRKHSTAREILARRGLV
jgi:hypothetical protein